MAVPPGAMAGMTGGKPAGPPMPPPPGAPQPGAGPAGSPMSTPQAPGGMLEGAKLKVMTSIKTLEMALGTFGSTSEEGKAVMKAISALAKAFGKHEDESKELMPAEIKQLMAGLAGPGAPPGPPAGGAPPPGGPPPGAPPQVG